MIDHKILTEGFPDRSRLDRERETLVRMIHLFCRFKHDGKETLCDHCKEISSYGSNRLNQCPYKNDKPVCSECKIHCYSPLSREKIKEIMRFSGPLMTLFHPILAVRHLLDKRYSHRKDLTMKIKKTSSFILLIIVFLSVSSFVFAEESKQESRLIFSPLMGIIKSNVEYTSSYTNKVEKIKDSGALYGIHMVYARPQFVIGTLGHFSSMDHSKESGYLLTGNYFFRHKNSLQPTVGFNLEYLNVHSTLYNPDVSPLQSMEIQNQIFVYYPTIGLLIKNRFFQITPNIGYFKEVVEANITSEGMRVGPTMRFGFHKKSYADLDYMAVGTKLELTISHFVHVDSKFYVRFRNNESRHFTTRNRLDIYLTRKFGLTAKCDYFEDNFETNLFFYAGPAFVF